MAHYRNKGPYQQNCIQGKAAFIFTIWIIGNAKIISAMLSHIGDFSPPYYPVAIIIRLSIIMQTKIGI